MSGLAGYAFPMDSADARRRLRGAATAFSGPNHQIRTWADDRFAVCVASRFERERKTISYGEICVDGALVLGIEGYLVEMPRLSAPASAERSRGRRLLELYRQQGEELFARLGGGFSLAVWNRDERRLVLYVSKLGQRQLYRMERGETLFFSTEIKTLPLLSGEPLELDQAGLANNLLTGLNYGTGTCFRHVRRLFQGTGLRASQRSRATFAPRFLPENPAKSSLSSAELAEELDRLLRQAVSRLAGVGAKRAVLLSSGVDSTLVAGLVKTICGDLRSFTQALPGASESLAAARIAEHLGSEHRTVEYSYEGSDLIEELTRQVEIFEEPSWTQFGLAMIGLMEEVHTCAEVFFHGTSADMIFGSPAHAQFDMARAEEVAAYVPQAFDPEIMRHFVRDPEEAHEDFLEVVRDFLPPRPFDRLSYGQLMSVARDTISPGSYLAQRFGTEAVCPYLDEEVVRFSFALPDRTKMDGGRPKPLLRRLLETYVPPGLVPATKVGYWVDVLRDSYEKDLLGPALDLLDEKKTRERGVYHSGFLEPLIHKYRSREVRAGWHRILWQILACEIFCRRFVDLESRPPGELSPDGREAGESHEST